MVIIKEVIMTKSRKWVLTRRFFLKSSVSLAAAPFLFAANAMMRAFKDENSLKKDLLRGTRTSSFSGVAPDANRKPAPGVRFGMLTDSHYADIDTRGTRYYRESISKMHECIELMNDKQVDFVIQLGDFKNGAPDNNMENLRRFEDVYAKFSGPRYHVLGNHDMDSISKPQFMSVIENTGIDKDASYYSFDHGNVRFIVLDANFREDGKPYDTGNFSWMDSNIPAVQREWLDNELRSTDRPVIIFIHQLLDNDEGNHYVRNASEIRRVLERHTLKLHDDEHCPKVLAVFQGHQHRGQYNLINNIHYYTLKAMVEGSGKENNSYAIVELFDDLSIEIKGYRKAVNHTLESIPAEVQG